jgi:hypothetical protein
MSHVPISTGAFLASEGPTETVVVDPLLSAFNVSVVLQYTAHRPPTWGAHDEAEYVRSNTLVGPHALAGVEVTYFMPSEPEADPGDRVALRKDG